MKRSINLALRAISMVMVFVTGIVVLELKSSAQVALFVAISAQVPLLIALLGLELHTVTDRLAAAGLEARDALTWVVRRELPGCLLAIAVAAVLSLLGVVPPLLAGLVLCLVVLGLFSQEAFRLLVVKSRPQSANATLLLRTALPFGIALPLWREPWFTVTDFLWLWIAGSALSMAVGFWALRHRTATPDAPTLPARREAAGTVLTYFPIAIMVRSLLSLDVVILALVVADEQVGLYGNVNNAMLAAFTVADVAIIQWRLGSVLAGGGRPDRRLRRELRAVAGLAGLGVTGLGVVLIHRHGILDDTSAAAAYGVVACLGLSAVLALVCQSTHLELYSGRHDRRLARSYAAAFAVYAAVLVVAWISGLVLVFAVAKVLGWSVLAISLQRERVRSQKERSLA